MDKESVVSTVLSYEPFENQKIIADTPVPCPFWTNYDLRLLSLWRTHTTLTIQYITLQQYNTTNESNTMNVWLLTNFRAKALPSSPSRIDVKDLFSYVYAFLSVWNLLLVALYNYYARFWILVDAFCDNTNHTQETTRSTTTTTTTTTLFGKRVTIDIPPHEFPSTAKISAMEATMPDCCQHGWFPSTFEGHQLHYRYFLPAATKPKAIIIWMHGLQGFGGEAHILNTTCSTGPDADQNENGKPRRQRKTNMALQAERYLQQGYAVYALDALGHGFSEGRRWFMPSGEVMLADYIRFIQRVASAHDTTGHNNNTQIHTYVPIFLSGYSYGGCLTLKAANYFQEHPQDAPKNFKGIVLQAPAIYDLECLFLFPLVVWVLQHLIHPILGASFRPPEWMPNRVHPRRFWRDPERYRAGMIRDGLNSAGHHIPMQTCLTLVEDMVTLRNDTIPNLQVPFCVVHGTRDRVVATTGTRYLQRASKTSSGDQACHFFPGAYHDLLGEPEADTVMDVQVNWIQERINQQ